MKPEQKKGLGRVIGLTVQSGGTLNASGTVAQPIVFTSLKDDTVVESATTTVLRAGLPLGIGWASTSPDMPP